MILRPSGSDKTLNPRLNSVTQIEESATWPSASSSSAVESQRKLACAAITWLKQGKALLEQEVDCVTQQIHAEGYQFMLILQ